MRFDHVLQWPMARRTAAIACFVAVPGVASAQTSETFTACSQGALTNCTLISLTSTLGVGPGGLNLFEIALQNLGSTSSPTLATSIHFLSFTTGQPPVPPADFVDVNLPPVAVGGATVSDPSDWNVFETGDAIFLSALNNFGVGGCVAGAPIGGFGQMGNTCGSGQAIAFSFFTDRAFDAGNVRLSDLEIVGLSSNLPADSCNEQMPCVITPVVATPEPSTFALTLGGLSGVAGFRRRRRRPASVRA